MIKNIISIFIAAALMVSTVSAASYNTMSRSNIVVRDETSLAFANLQIEPKNQVETGSSIVVTITNATFFNQDILDGTSSDEKAIGYKKGGYQYALSSGFWRENMGFYDVMPNIPSAKLPYYIRKINDQQIEIKLINLPDIYANNSLERVNGVGRAPYYSIPLVAYSDGFGNIEINIDSNFTSISGGIIGQAEIFEKKFDSSPVETVSTEASTETTTQTVVEEKPALKTVNIQIGAYSMTVDGTTKNIDVPAYIQPQSQSTLVPLRAVSEAFGGNNAVEWIPETKTAVIRYNGNTVEFTSDGDYMKINGIEKEMKNNIKAEITKGRMFVPFRLLGEAMGLDVQWIPETKTAVYKDKK